MCDWMAGAEIWQMHPRFREHSHDGCREATSIAVEKKNTDFLCPPSFLTSHQPSSVSTMSDSSAPNFVYMRRKLRGNSVAIFSAQVAASPKRSGEDCLSVISSEAPSVAVMEPHMVSQCVHETQVVGTPFIPPLVCNGEPHAVQLESINRSSFLEDLGSNEASKNIRQRTPEVDSINDSCSSSKSNMELLSATMKTEVDDTGECSSSSVPVVGPVGEDLSEKDLCISILKSQGVLELVSPSRTHAPAEVVGDCSGESCSRSCKICGRTETAQKVLICDNCEEAFHPSCCNPHIKRIPSDEWFCHLCSKKKHKILKETISRKSPKIIGDKGKCRNASSVGELSPVALMLRDTEPYKTGVRVGKGFQAEVPDSLGPIINDVDTIGESLEMDPSDFVSLHELKSNKPPKHGFIGNWLQCKEVIYDAVDGANGTICGKWRRAPLFEVQTDDWECFCSVLWDPLHADCAVPQELDTDQVLKQLKYIQMLRPKLTTKRRRLDQNKNGCSLDSTNNVSNTKVQE